jgi:hypothetical protein
MPEQRLEFGDRQGHGFDPGAVTLWLVLHESGTFVKFTEAGAAMFA